MWQWEDFLEEEERLGAPQITGNRERDLATLKACARAEADV